MFDVIVIGAGPAGMTAALNVKREGKSVLLLEKENFGGQIALSPRVENIPSIKAISGEEYSALLFDHVSDLGVEFELEEVIGLSKNNGVFTVKTNYNEYESRIVIIAGGCQHRHIGVAREEELIGKGVSYCAVCDGAFYKGQEVCLIGDANTALQYALVLAGICTKVHICALFDKLFADKILINRVLEKDNIDIRYNISLQEFLGEDELTGLRFKDTKTNEEVRYSCKGVFIAVGQIPHNEIYKDFVELENGYIKTDELMRTKTEGLYAVGDCRVKTYRQVIAAESDGMIAAINASRYIDTH